MPGLACSHVLAAVAAAHERAFPSLPMLTRFSLRPAKTLLITSRAFSFRSRALRACFFLCTSARWSGVSTLSMSRMQSCELRISTCSASNR